MLIVPSGRLLQCLYSAQNFDREGIARNRHAKYSAKRPPIPVVANSIVHKTYGFLQRVLSLCVPAGSPSRGGDAAVYVSDIEKLSLPTPLYSVLVSIFVFMALSTVGHSIFLSTTLRCHTLFFRSYFCLIGPFNYTSLYESLLQP